jgi:hypothetical protein
MYGSHFAKDYVTTFLKSDIPTRIVRYRNGWNLDDISLPEPVEYFSYEPLALDSWPTIITVAISAKSFNRYIHESSFDPVYNVTYALRTYVWVRGGGSEEATLMRDRLTAVVRSALMDYPCFNRHDSSRDARIEESTLTEEYSDLTLLKGDRVMAGAFIGYDVVMEEAITRENIGTLQDIDLTVRNNGFGEDLQV